MSSGNNIFGLNINPQYRPNPARYNGTSFGNLTTGEYYGNNPADLRNKYSLTSRLNDFKVFLGRNGYNYEQYRMDKWNAQMMAKEQQQLANQEAITGTFSNLGTLAKDGMGLFNTVKGWFSKG